MLPETTSAKLTLWTHNETIENCISVPNLMIITNLCTKNACNSCFLVKNVGRKVLCVGVIVPVLASWFSAISV